MVGATLKNAMQDSLKRPLLFALGSYLAWGVFPIYWQFLKHLSALETLSHRMIWSFVFYLLIFLYRHLRGVKFLVRATKRDWALASLATGLLALNWGIYIYAVTHGHILESSLAYFINPLMSVAVGVWLLREPFPPLMKFACAMALAGVLVQMAGASEFPWIALILATSFCAYGLIKKVVALRPTQFSLMEGVIGLFPALIAAVYLRQESELMLTTTDWLLLAGGGVVTGLPLFLFAIAARELPYSLMGMLQFISPTLQFLTGMFLFSETLEPVEFLSFGLIWAGVGAYYADRIRIYSKTKGSS